MYYVSTKKKKKKKDWERTRLSEEITTLNVTVTQHRDLAPFLFRALFAAPKCLVSDRRQVVYTVEMLEFQKFSQNT